MIERCTDARLLACLCRRVDHQLGADEAEEFIADRRNVCLTSEYGAGLFQWTGPKIYGGHILMLPVGRGAHAVTAGKAMVKDMAERGARLIWATVPLGNRPARWFVRKVGFKSLGIENDREQFWMELGNG